MVSKPNSKEVKVLQIFFLQIISGIFCITQVFTSEQVFPHGRYCFSYLEQIRNWLFTQSIKPFWITIHSQSRLGLRAITETVEL